MGGGWGRGEVVVAAEGMGGWGRGELVVVVGEVMVLVLAEGMGDGTRVIP